MRGHVVTVGRPPRRPATMRAARRATRAVLTASGVAPVPVLTSLDVSRIGPVEREWYDRALAAGNTEYGSDLWPCELTELAESPLPLIRGGVSEAVYEGADGSLILVQLHGGWFSVRVATKNRASVGEACAAFRATYPAAYITQSEDSRIPITFWTMGPFGPVSRLRKIEATRWEPIQGNYTAAVADELENLMGWTDGPGRDGQLILWQGEPGTGKTWALRALASEWAPWAEFHYITDPDQFFVETPSYMVDVLLADSYEAIDPATDMVVTENAAGQKWRVLILEDTGELLSASARERYGQGLSRLLNVVDGMIGQGLRVIALVTTNDELGELHPAVSRPGRCASQLSFGPLSAEEASVWLGADTEAGTLAELYERRGTAGHDAFSDTDARSEIARVAAAHQPDEPGYGQTAWNPDTGTVLWISWDGTSVAEHDAAEAAFLAIPGVKRFLSAAEGIPDPEWWDAEVVYPENPPRWVTDRSLAASASPDEELARLIELAGSPLPDLEPGDAARYGHREPNTMGLGESIQAALSTLAASGEATTDRLAYVLETIAAQHRVTMGAIEKALVASAAPAPDGGSSALTLAALGVVSEFARRPDPPAQPIHVVMPERSVDVHVSPAEAHTQVDVHVPPATPQEVPVVNVNVPAQEPPVVNVAAAAPPPDVHVTVEQPPAPPPRTVVVETDEHGRRVYRQE